MSRRKRAREESQDAVPSPQASCADKSAPDAEPDNNKVGVPVESEKLLTNLTAMLPVGVYITTTSGYCVYVNPHWCEMAGVTPEQALGEGWQQAIHPEDRSRVFEEWSRYAQAGGQWNQEYRFQTPSGKTTWVHGRAMPIRGEDGAIASYIGVNVDISEYKAMEATLRRSESILDETGRMGRIGGWEHDLVTGKAVWTAALYDIIQIDSAQEPPGPAEHLDYYLPEYRTALREAYQRAIEEGTPFDLELQAHTAKGHLIWCRAYGEPVFQDGKCVKMRGTFQDITNRKQAEEASREAQRRLALALQSADIGIWDWDLASNEVYFSPEWKSQIGYRDDELPNAYEEWENRLHPEDRETTLQKLQQYRQGLIDELVAEYRLRHKDGGYRWIFTRGEMSRDASGKPVRMTGCNVDITEHKRAEEAISNLARFPAENPDPVLRIAGDGVLKYANRASEKLLAEWECRVGQEVPSYWRDLIAEVLSSGSARQIEHRLHEQVLAFTLSPVVEDGYVNIYGRDVTEQRRVELQLRQSQKMEAIGQLAGGIAHDFRNQLTVIKGYSEILLRQTQLPQDEQEKLEEILTAADRSDLLTGQLLAFSRKEMLLTQTVRLFDLISNIAKSLPRLIGEDIRVHIKNSAEEVVVLVDPGQFQQALLNLATNARDAMPDGGTLTMDVSTSQMGEDFEKRHPGIKSGTYALLTVTDTGHGMTPETKEKLFEPFFTTKPVGEGTGLGLSMVYGFVKQSGGTIEVDSEMGIGTTFRLYFPLAEMDEESSDSAAGTQNLQGGTETILIVEDEAQIRQMLNESLSDAGYTVFGASEIQEALSLAERHAGRIDALITDVVMPGGSGVTLAEKIRRDHPRMPILFLSGYGGKELSRRGVEPGKEAVLAKPYSHEKLLRMVRQLLDGQTES